jgi:hypothetical protein
LLTFLALKKVRRLAGRDPPVLLLFLILVLLLIHATPAAAHGESEAGGWRLEAGGCKATVNLTFNAKQSYDHFS